VQEAKLSERSHILLSLNDVAYLINPDTPSVRSDPLYFGGDYMGAMQQGASPVVTFHRNAVRAWTRDLTQCVWECLLSESPWNEQVSMVHNCSTRVLMPPTRVCQYYRLVVSSLHEPRTYGTIPQHMTVFRIGDHSDSGTLVGVPPNNDKFYLRLHGGFAFSGHLYGVEDANGFVFRVDLDTGEQKQVQHLVLPLAFCNPVRQLSSNLMTYVDETRLPLIFDMLEEKVVFKHRLRDCELYRPTFSESQLMRNSFVFLTRPHVALMVTVGKIGFTAVTLPTYNADNQPDFISTSTTVFNQSEPFARVAEQLDDDTLVVVVQEKHGSNLVLHRFSTNTTASSQLFDKVPDNSYFSLAILHV
jgi:hypothetical protein